jgi:hypothetical protein
MGAATEGVTAGPFRPDVFVRPPPEDARAPLGVPAELSLTPLRIEAAEAGRLLVVDERGLRFAEAHKAAGAALQLWLAGARRYEVRFAGRRYGFEARGAPLVLSSAAALPEGEVIAARGEAWRALEGLYRDPFSPDVVRGYRLGHDDAEVAAGGTAPGSTLTRAEDAWQTPALLGGGAALLVAGGGPGGVGRGRARRRGAGESARPRRAHGPRQRPHLRGRGGLHARGRRARLGAVAGRGDAVILAARARGRSFLAAVGAAAALGQAGCLRDAPLTDARCPCVDGYVCCASVDRCVRPDEICPGSTDAAPAPEPDASPSPLPPDAAPSLPTHADARGPIPEDAGLADAALADAAAPVDAAAGDAGTAFQIATFEPTEGPHTGGTVVDLTGAGFTPETRVRFGPYTAPDVTFLGADHLRVTTPPGAVDVPAVDVVVEVADRRAVAASAFRYVLPPMVEVTEAAGLFGGRGIGVVATDADGDGRRDLVTARTEGPLPGYWRALADLRFVPGVEGPGLAGLPYLEDLVPVDLDATPPLEFVALRTWLPPRETLYVLDGVTGAAAARLPGNLEAVSSWDALVPFDVDGDGDIDLAGVRISPLFEANVTTAGSILRAEGGRLTAEPSAFAFAPGVRPAAEVYGLTAADLDADGFVDLLLLLDGVPHLHRGGPGGLRPQVEVWPLPAPDMKLGAPAIADLDADGGGRGSLRPERPGPGRSRRDGDVRVSIRTRRVRAGAAGSLGRPAFTLRGRPAPARDVARRVWGRRHGGRRPRRRPRPSRARRERGLPDRAHLGRERHRRRRHGVSGVSPHGHRLSAPADGGAARRPRRRRGPRLRGARLVRR